MQVAEPNGSDQVWQFHFFQDFFLEKKKSEFFLSYWSFSMKKTFMSRNAFRTFLSSLSYKVIFQKIFFGKSIPMESEVIHPELRH